MTDSFHRVGEPDATDLPATSPLPFGFVLNEFATGLDYVADLEYAVDITLSPPGDVSFEVLLDSLAAFQLLIESNHPLAGPACERYVRLLANMAEETLLVGDRLAAIVDAQSQAFAPGNADFDQRAYMVRRFKDRCREIARFAQSELDARRVLLT